MTVQNLKLRVPVNFPVSVQGAGGISVSKANGIWTIQPKFSDLSAITASAVSDPTTKQIWIYDPTTKVYNVLTLAGLGNALFTATSTTSLLIGAGSKTFVTQSGKDFSVGSWLYAASAADAANYMIGQVTSYSGTSLVVNITAFGGSGTHTDWNLNMSDAPGSQGVSSGYSYLWNTSTSAADPGSGKLSANNATFASITTIYISETDHDGNALASEIATWGVGTSTIFGRLKAYDPVTPTNFMTFDVTAFVDSGTYDTLTVTPIATGGAFTASLALRLEFTPKGDKGATGAAGAAGNATMSGVTTHGVALVSAATTMASTAVMSDGQVLVGQSAADPLPKTISGDATLSAAGALTLANGASTRSNLGLAIGTNVQAFDAQLSSNIPQNSKSAAYTTVLTDGEKHIFHPAADVTARVWTIDSNANVAYPIGTAITFAGEASSGVVTLAITTDTLVWLPSGSTGSRTLTAPFLATAFKVTSTKWFLTGAGIT